METVEKKGITTKVDVELHAKAKQYMADHGDMNMETFITKAIDGLATVWKKAPTAASASLPPPPPISM